MVLHRGVEKSCSELAPKETGGRKNKLAYDSLWMGSDQSACSCIYNKETLSAILNKRYNSLAKSVCPMGLPW